MIQTPSLGVCYPSRMGTNTTAWEQSFEMWDQVWTGVFSTQDETTSWNTYPPDPEGSPVFCRLQLWGKILLSHPEGSLGQERRWVWPGRAVAHDVCAVLRDFQTMKTKVILLKMLDPNIRGWRTPAFWWGVLSWIPILTVSHLFLPPSLPGRRGSGCRFWQMWVEVPALPLTSSETWGNCEPSLNLSFFIYEMGTNNRSCNDCTNNKHNIWTWRSSRGQQLRGWALECEPSASTHWLALEQVTLSLWFSHL